MTLLDVYVGSSCAECCFVNGRIRKVVFGVQVLALRMRETGIDDTGPDLGGTPTVSSGCKTRSPQDGDYPACVRDLAWAGTTDYPGLTRKSQRQAKVRLCVLPLMGGGTLTRIHVQTM